MKFSDIHFPEIHIPERFRRPLKWVGFPLFAMFVFNLSMYVTLPRERIQDQIESVASEALGSKVSLEGFGLTMLFGPGITASRLVMTIKPEKPGDKPKAFAADDVTVRVGAVAALRGKSAVNFNGKIGDGKVSGELRMAIDKGLIVLDAEKVPLSKLPRSPDIIPVPIDGNLTLAIDLSLPKNLFAESGGSIQITCDDCSVGDGKAKFTSPLNPMLAQGLTVPKIKIGRLVGTMTVVKGKGTLKEFKAHSPDLDIELDGSIDLRDPVSLSQLKLYLRIKPSDALLKREAAIEAMVSMGGSLARRTDGYYGLSISGAAQGPIVLPSKDPPPGIALASATRPVAPVTAAPPPLRSPSAPSPGVASPPARPLTPPPSDPEFARPSLPAPPSGASAPTISPTAPTIPPPARVGIAGHNFRNVIDQTSTGIAGSEKGGDAPEGETKAAEPKPAEPKPEEKPAEGEAPKKEE